MLSQIHLTVKDMQKLRVWKTVYKANRSHKQVNITILISDKVDFELKLIRIAKMNICFEEGNKLPRKYKNLYLCTKPGAPYFIKQTLKGMKKNQVCPDTIQCFVCPSHLWIGLLNYNVTKI